MPVDEAASPRLLGQKPKTERELLRVLIIDDQPHVRTWARRILSNIGVTDVTEAYDGRSGLAAVTGEGAWFDLILCDLRMPERDGIETLRTFAALNLQSAVAIMSMEPERVIDTADLLGELQGLRMLSPVQKPLTVEKAEGLLAQMLEVRGEKPAELPPVPREDFPNAFARSELVMFYQPKIALRTGLFAGAEALVRWKHPQLGLVLPDLFIPEMESTEEASAALAEFTLAEAMACAGRWKEDERELRVAINLSAQAFVRLDFPDRLERLAREAGVSSDLVTLEVTESQLAKDAVRMLDVCTRLRLKGFSLAIDDFGTGHSGLSSLQRLPFNELKIDRSFVHGCSTSASKRSVVETSISLARNLKMTSVAEGIQRRPDWDLLVELGCEVMQGFFVARPMSEDALRVWATKWELK
jgi:EAL domain-containing protein (putative c-di-GMP-specific phosphodiesterase class I)/CheY-like chemotaxis protein